MGKYSRTWLIITGVILLVVGGGMALTLGSLPFAGGGMLFTGGILAVVGIGLIVAGIIVGRNAGQVDQLLATGVPASAQIVGMTQTGMYLNEQPLIELNLLVTIPGQTPFAAKHKSFVPLMLLGRLSSGQPLSVRVDPADYSRIAIDWQNTGAFGAPMGMPAGAPPLASGGSGYGMTPAGNPDESLSQVQAALAASGASAAAPFANAAQGNYSVEQLRAYLRQSGIEAQARIEKLTDTGQIVGDERLYTMQTTLMMPGKPPKLQTESAAMVPLTAMHKVHVGATIPVRVAAENENLMMFEWDKA
jgi:hypothetical protein